MFFARQDYHTHTRFSVDSSCEPAALLSAAVVGDVNYLAITDHFDVPEKNSDSVKTEFYTKAEAVWKEVLPLTAGCPSVRVARGIELGQPLWAKEMTAGLIKNFDFDVVLASQHGVDGLEDYYWVNMAESDEVQIFNNYFDTLLQLVQWNEFDVLAHLTYPVRYYFRDNHCLPDLTPYDQKIDAVLETLVQNDRALEINLSGLATDLQVSMPDLSIATRYRQLGGQKITIGTDDHHASTTKYLPERGLVLAYEAGFRHFTVYDKRVPTLVRFAD